MRKEIQRNRRTTFGRSGGSFILGMIWNIFSMFSSPCMMLIEVFTRKDFGERYFRFYKTVWIFVVLAWLPFTAVALSAFYTVAVEFDVYVFLLGIWPFVGWYIYLALFLKKSFQHRAAIKAIKQGNRFAYDTAVYSYDEGTIHPAFFKIKIKGERPTMRMVECWLEPAPFFIGGIALLLLGQALSFLLIFCSLIYAITYFVAYRSGDQGTLNRIDQMILNQDMEESYLDETETQQHRFVGRKPDAPTTRRAVSDLAVEKAREDEDGLLAK